MANGIMNGTYKKLVSFFVNGILNRIPFRITLSSSSHCSSALCNSHVCTWLEYCRAWLVASSGWCCAGVGDNKT